MYAFKISMNTVSNCQGIGKVCSWNDGLLSWFMTRHCEQNVQQGYGCTSSAPTTLAVYPESMTSENESYPTHKMHVQWNQWNDIFGVGSLRTRYLTIDAAVARISIKIGANSSREKTWESNQGEHVSDIYGPKGIWFKDGLEVLMPMG